MDFDALSESDFGPVLDLFCGCFSEDHYYRKLFSGAASWPDEMRASFQPSIAYCLSRGKCLGVRSGGELIAFVLCFDYGRVMREDAEAFGMIFRGDAASGDELPYFGSLHQTIRALPGDTIFCLSVAVRPEFGHRGIASALIDEMMELYPGYNFACDVSNEQSLEIYRKRNFAVSRLDEGYFLALHDGRLPAHTFAVGESVQAAVPDTGFLTDNGIVFRMIKEETYLLGYEACESFGISYFAEKGKSVCRASLVDFDYDQYLGYQRLINVAQYNERFFGGCVMFVSSRLYTGKPLMDPNLQEMIRSRRTEWSLIPDIYVSVPVQYKNRELIASGNAADDPRSAFLLKNLDFRTHYEAGVPSAVDNVDDLASFKNRIRRFYLGKIKIRISQEPTIDSYEQPGTPIGAAALVDMYISIDEESDCAVVTWYSLSAPFLLSHLMDNVISNQLMLYDGDRQINVYDYLYKYYGIIKRGTPKIFVVIPKSRDCLSESQVASLFASETIYPDGENFGKIVDPEILGIAASEYGMGQYDRAFVGAYNNVVLEFCPDFRDTLLNRMGEEAITLFYIELILYEEAAIHIADQEIIRLCTCDSISDPVDFLSRVDAIYDDYSRTIDFWDIQVNYPTSQKSIEMLRTAFRIKYQQECMHRNQEQLQTVFNTKCDIIDRRDSRRMNSSLAVISVLAVFSAWIDGHDYIATWGDVLSAGAVHLLQRVLFLVVLILAVYAVTHLFKSKAPFPSGLRRAKKGGGPSGGKSPGRSGAQNPSEAAESGAPRK